MSCSFSASADSSGWAVPASLHIWGAGGEVYFKHNASSCAGDNIYELLPSHAAFHTIFSMLMMAYKEKLEVEIRYEECRSDGKRPRVMGVYFR